jgi:hypothetical protein
MPLIHGAIVGVFKYSRYAEQENELNLLLLKQMKAVLKASQILSQFQINCAISTCRTRSKRIGFSRSLSRNWQRH